jgi:hypothetical protein
LAGNFGLLGFFLPFHDFWRDALVLLYRFFRACGPARLPAVYSDRLLVMAGGLMCYSTDRADQFRTAASYIVPRDNQSERRATIRMRMAPGVG